MLLAVWLALLQQAADPGIPGSPAQLFEEANRLYRAGDFASAEEHYRRLVGAPIEGGAVYFNLGNACFKQKKLGEAIYFWELARTRLPRDRELEENLELANLLIIDRIEVPPDPFPVRVVDRAVHYFSIPAERHIVLGLWIAGNVLFGLRCLVRHRRLRATATGGIIAASLFFLVFGASLGWKLYDQTHRREGVVVGAKVDIRSGPGSENVTVFTVHEGMRLRVRGEAGAWYQVSLPNGWSGWTEKGGVRVL